MLNSKFCYLLLIALATLSLTGCFKEKALDRPTVSGTSKIGEIDMGPYYGQQFFFNLKTDSVVSHNSRTAYDLMFDCGDSVHIWLNSAKFMSVAHTGKHNMDSVTIQDTVGHDFVYETGAYNPDSSAIGQWWESGGTSSTEKGSKQEVLIVNLGVDTTGKVLGFIKLKIGDYLNGNYTLFYSAIDKKENNLLIVTKDPSRNYKYVSFANTASIVDIEPDKNNWDLVFTHYTTNFYLPYYLPYQVTGVLSNPSKVSCYMDSTLKFYNVSITDLNQNKLSSRRDVIGYTWKSYSGGASGSYSTDTMYTYFINAGGAEYYKLRFITFNKGGIRGYPTFEYVPL